MLLSLTCIFGDQFPIFFLWKNKRVGICIYKKSCTRTKRNKSSVKMTYFFETFLPQGSYHNSTKGIMI